MRQRALLGVVVMVLASASACLAQRRAVQPTTPSAAPETEPTGRRVASWPQAQAGGGGAGAAGGGGGGSCRPVFPSGVNVAWIHFANDVPNPDIGAFTTVFKNVYQSGG